MRHGAEEGEGWDRAPETTGDQAWKEKTPRKLRGLAESLSSAPLRWPRRCPCARAQDAAGLGLVPAVVTRGPPNRIPAPSPYAVARLEKGTFRVLATWHWWRDRSDVSAASVNGRVSSSHPRTNPRTHERRVVGPVGPCASDPDTDRRSE